MAAMRDGFRCLVGVVAVAACLAGCEQEPDNEPHGGGYVAPQPRKPGDPPDPPAHSALGKAKQAADKLVNEDIAEYNKKLEQAVDGKYP